MDNTRITRRLMQNRKDQENKKMEDVSVFLVFFLAWIIGTIIAVAIASRRGVSTGLVALLSIFFSPVIGVLVACLMTPKVEEEPDYRYIPEVPKVPEKKCPKCAEMVKEEAVICRFCGYDFSPDIAAKTTEEARLVAIKAQEEAEWESNRPVSISGRLRKREKGRLSY
jgi:heme/copper-type cytochrome/quinol oxidase subunit 4